MTRSNPFDYDAGRNVDTPAIPRAKFFAILLCFFLSGSAGLIYQVAWTKALGLIFGHTVYAIATVLAAFMGGLALGSAVLGRWGDRYPNAVALYGWIELAIAATGAVSLVGIQAVRSLYFAAFPAVSGSIPLLVGLRFVAAAIVLLIPTFLMGGTLPILVRGLTRGSAELGERIGRLYWVNTAGAVAGTLAAGFVLLPNLGLRFTVGIAVALNIVAGVVALLLRNLAAPPESASAEAVPEESPAATGATPWFLLGSFAVVGGTAIVYEVAWTRLLVTTLGSSTYAFTVMLATFLVGIVLGSRLFERWVGRGKEPSLSTYAATQTLTGLAALSFLVIFQQLPVLMWKLLTAMDKSFSGLVLAQFATSALAMLPAALVFGFNFPVVTLLIAGRQENKAHHAAAVGRACAANTLGAIVGATAAGFWLVPRLGSFRLVALTAATNLLLALLLELRRRPRRTVVLLGSAVLVMAVAGAGWRNLLYDPAIANFSTIFYRDRYHAALTLGEVAHTTDLLFAEDGLNASIAVVRSQNYLALRTNGKVDASTGDMVTQLMVGHLGNFFHPAPKKVLIIGFGSGMTVNTVSLYKEVERIDCVEIEPAVIHAARHMEALNHGVLRDPRLRVILDDARNFLLTTRERYDLIISEPSNPWIAGVATLFTDEFYKEVRARLAPGGILVQWIQAYSIYPQDLRMVMATMLPHYAQVTLWRGQRRDFILVGQAERKPLTLDRFRSLWPNEMLRGEFERMGMRGPEALAGFHLHDDADLRRLVAGSAINTDNHTRLEYRAPLALFAANAAVENYALLARNRSQELTASVPLEDPRSAAALAAEALMNLGEHEYAERFVRLLEKETPTAQTELVRGRWLLELKKLPEARAAFENARRLDPLSLIAVHGLAEVARRLGEWDAAEHFLQQILARQPQYVPALQSYALLEQDRGRWDQAITWQSKRIQADAERGSEDFALLGDFLYRGDDQQRAGTAFIRALQLDPYNYVANRQLGEIFRRQQRWEQARLHFEAVLRYHPAADPGVYVALAEVYRLLSRFGDADRTLRKGRRIFPDDDSIAQALRAN